MTIYPVPKPVRTPKRVERSKGQRAQRTKGHLFDKMVSTGRRSWIRRQACIATGAHTGDLIGWRPWMPESWKSLAPWRAKIVVAHVRSRGAAGADEGNVVPLDAWLHDWQGQVGWREFAKRLRLADPKEIAATIEEQYQARAVAIAKNMQRRAERGGQRAP